MVDEYSIRKKFWKERLSKALKEYKIKSGSRQQVAVDSAKGEKCLSFLERFVGTVVEGICETVDKSEIKTEIRESHNCYPKYTRATISIQKNGERNTFWKNVISPPKLSLTVYADRDSYCAIDYGSAEYAPHKLIHTAPPREIGRLLASLSLSFEQDSEDCDREVLKANKIQQIAIVSFSSLLREKLKGSGMKWSVTGQSLNKINIFVKIAPRRVLSMTVKCGDCDVQKIMDAIDEIYSFINRDKIDMKITGESRRINWNDDE